jgi:hypothetical protein
MSFTLARTISCSDEGCFGQLLDDDSAIDAPLSPRMIEIRTSNCPYMNVALDRSSLPPMIRWQTETRPAETQASDRHTILGQESSWVDMRPKAARDPNPRRQHGNHALPARQRRDRKLSG